MNKKLIFGAMPICLPALSLTLIGCPTESDDGGGEGGATIPAAYQNTTWVSDSGHKLVFTTNSVKAAPGGYQETEIKFILVYESFSDPAMTTLVFGTGNDMQYESELSIDVKTDDEKDHFHLLIEQRIGHPLSRDEIWWNKVLCAMRFVPPRGREVLRQLRRETRHILL
jgi:hypothetical protein